jgi:2-polyprenyl-3-methyl-5-hydroxy-6-metoxy-1,4-benzoquinol methylase
MSKEYFSACPLCNSGDLVAVKEYSMHHLVKCRNCSFVFSRKIPSDAELAYVYNTFFLIQQSVSPITVKRYHEMLDYFEPYRKTNNIIDVGCGDGYFLDEAKKRGWNVYGTEYMDSKVAFCRQKGISMAQGILNPNNYTPDFFDVIASIEVIEHINNANEEIKNFNRILRHGGIVYLTTPHYNSLSRYVFHGKWNVISYPSHLSFYTKKPLKKLFESSGFALVRFATTGISVSQAKLSLGKNISQKSGSLSDVNMREAIEGSRFLQWGKKMANLILTTFNLGDTIKAVFVKR